MFLRENHMDVGCSQSLKQLLCSGTALIKDTLSFSPGDEKKMRLCFIEIREMVYVFLNHLLFAVFIHSEELGFLKANLSFDIL